MNRNDISLWVSDYFLQLTVIQHYHATWTYTFVFWLHYTRTPPKASKQSQSLAWSCFCNTVRIHDDLRQSPLSHPSTGWQTRQDTWISIYWLYIGTLRTSAAQSKSTYQMHTMLTLLTLRLLMSYIYIYKISSLRVNIIKWQVKFNPVA